MSEKVNQTFEVEKSLIVEEGLQNSGTGLWGYFLYSVGIFVPLKLEEERKNPTWKMSVRLVNSIRPASTASSHDGHLSILWLKS